MKHLTFLALLLTLFGCKTTNGQVKFNGDFETINPKTTLPSGWTHPLSMEKGYKYSADSVIKYSGRYSFSISKFSDSAAWGSTGYLIPNRFKGKEIELRGYIKTENVTRGYAGFWLRIDGTTAFNNMNDQNIHGTTDWKEYSIKLPYDDGKAINIYAGIILDGAGKMWADNMRLFIDGKPIAGVQIVPIILSKAELDTAFKNTSGIMHVDTGKQQITNLTMLGEVWGFIKYHHPAVAGANFNMDAELFRVMPNVIEAGNNSELSQALETWVNKFGVPNPCVQCQNYKPDSTTEKPDYGHLFDSSILTPSLTAKLKFILDNGNITKSFYIEMFEGAGNPVFKNESPNPSIDYPDVGYRILCLYRYWNMIQYFAPDKRDIGVNWNGILSAYLPRFINATNATDYLLAATALISSIHDTHANLWSMNPAFEAYRGIYGLPVMTKFINNKLVVTGYYADTLGIKSKLMPGDVINTINGKDVDMLVKRYLPITAASNYAAQLRDIPKNYLLRSNSKNFSLNITRDAQIINIDVESIHSMNINYSQDFSPDKNTPGYYLINNGQIGYISPSRYHNNDLPNIEKMFSNTKGIIVDMRCYPSDFMPFTFVPFIKSGNLPFVKFRVGDVSHPGYFTNSQLLVNNGTGEYKGKVIVIVNEVTQSSAEYTTMAFQSSPNVTVIGSTTAGADGNVSQIFLPGNISTMISGLGVLYPDGTDSQRNGVKININIEPTIAGIRAGKDELLEKAKALISASN